MVYIKIEKTDFIILDFLIRNINKEYSIKELSEELKRPYVKVHNSIKRLAERGIINENIKGKSHYCSINYKTNIGIVYFITFLRVKNFLIKNKKVSILINDIINEIKFPDYILLLFGSYIKETNNKHSDIDIAMITSNENKEEAERIMHSIKRISSLDIHFLQFSYGEFIEMLKAKNNNVGKEIAKDSIIFKGGEQFYNCMILAE